MTLKLRLTAMMGFLLLAVIALQFLLAERERRSMEDRLSRLGSEVSRGTQSVLERVRDMSWTLCDTTMTEGGGASSRVAMFTATHTAGESLRVRVNASSSDGGAIVTRNEATRIFVKRVEPHPAGVEPPAAGAVLMLEDSGVERDGKTFNRRVERRLPADSVEVVVQQLLGELRTDSIPNFFMRLHAEDAQRAVHAGGSDRTRTDVVVNLPLPLRGLDQVYAVEMRFPTNDLLAELERARRRSVVWLAALVSVGVVGAVLMATQFTRPLRDLRASFQKVEQGDLSVALPLKRRDEIGQLTESFNHMVSRLREQRGVEERLAEAERMASIGRMASGVAHEVRNPLNAILLTLEQLREKSRDQDLDRYHDIVSAEITRLERLVSTFLELARASEVQRERHDVAEGLRAAVELFRPEIEQKGARLEATIEAPLLLDADRFRLPNVWNNLLANAAAVVGEEGLVQLDARRERGAEGERLVVTVRDDGPGIAPEILPRIWEPFFSGRKDGTGLGLSIVRSVVEAHGGTVSATSTAAAGATFRVNLPLD